MLLSLFRARGLSDVSVRNIKMKAFGEIVCYVAFTFVLSLIATHPFGVLFLEQRYRGKCLQGNNVTMVAFIVN